MAEDLRQLTVGDFEPHLGESFAVALDQGTLPLTLDEACASGTGTRPGGAFSLQFTGPHGDHLPQAIYRLDHAALGGLDLFLVPIGPDERGHRYQAIFN